MMHPPEAAQPTLQDRVRELLHRIAHRLPIRDGDRTEARRLLQAIQEAGDSPHYVEPRPGWEPGVAFEGQDKPKPAA